MPPQHYRTAVPLGLLLAAMLLTGLTTCSSPYTRNGYTVVPLNGPGGGLPANGTLPSGDSGPIHFDSLYARIVTTKLAPERYTQYVDYIRFWPTGRVLLRAKPKPSSDEQVEKPIVSGSNGDIINNDLAGPPLGFAESVGVVGYYCLVGDDIYIEVFAWDMEGPSYRLFAGKLTEDGFVLNRLQPERPLIPAWHSIPEQRYVRYRVGPMRGEPTW